MESIPWYKSPVYIGIVVNLVAGVVNVLGWQDFVTIDAITSNVTNFFMFAALIGAVVAERARRKSTVQPLTLTQK